MSFNVHRAIRSAISWAHPDEFVTVLRATGHTVDDEGMPHTTYEVDEDVRAQAQAESDSALFHSSNAGMNSYVMRFYLLADKEPVLQVAPVDRANARSGDFIYRNDYGTWWQVDAVIDQYSRCGWKSVRATRQTSVPDEVMEAWNECDCS